MSSKFSDKDEINVFFPCDHYIKNHKKFIKSINLALANYKQDYWNIFGIEPSFPHDGFGYIKIENKENVSKSFNPYVVKNLWKNLLNKKPQKCLKKKIIFGTLEFL